MLKLHIPFHDSWTAQFADDKGNPLFTSSTQLSKARPTVPVNLNEFGNSNPSRVELMRAANRANPDMAQRVPATYDNTVLGVVARLMGEVRRVRVLDETHPARQAMASGRYEVTVTDESDEVVSFATPPNAIQSQGCGVISDTNPFYNGSDLAKQLFGHLSLSVHELLQGAAAAVPWSPSSPSEFVLRMKVLKDEQDALVKRAFKKDAAGNFDSTLEVLRTDLEAFMASLGKTLTDLGANSDAPVSAWHWHGAVAIARFRELSQAQREELLEKGTLKTVGNLPGVSGSGAIGNVTEKDVFTGAGGKQVLSTRMPYQGEIPVLRSSGKKQCLPMGIIVKSGHLDIVIDAEPEFEQYVHDLIDCAAVGPFVFGKKGIAYLEHMELT